MTSLASRLPKCTASQLKSLAELIGINTTGTKGVLVESLQTEILRRPLIAPFAGANGKAHRPTRILSIDMGIRNLAFCVLEVQASEKRDSQPLETVQVESVSDIESAMKSTRSVLDSVKLVAWKRTSLYDLLDADDRPGIAVSAIQPPSPAELAESEETGKSASTKSVALQSKPPVPKEAFDPATFARLTYKLVTRVFLPYNVSHVLIERQRYRSGSAPAIMEWTVRVNMLESMLHAVFGTLRSEATPLGEQTPTSSRPLNRGIDEIDAGNSSLREAEADIISLRWTVSTPKVHPISPRKVGVFWDKIMPVTAGVSHRSKTTRAEPDGSTGVKKPSRSKVEKEAKIAIVERILTQGEPNPLKLSVEAKDACDAFLAVRDKKNSKRGGRVKSETLEIVAGRTNPSSKLDDLADCFLQAAAWAQWEMNRRDLRESLQRQVAGSVDIPVDISENKSSKKKKRKTRQVNTA